MSSEIRTSRAGFSLIELSIWITILAILAAAFLSFLTPPSVQEMEKIAITQKNMRVVLDALVDFRATNKRLPCPALRTLNDDNALAYSEDCTSNRGIVPARTLGIPEEYALDGWGRRLTYHVATTVCNTDASGLPVNCTEGHYRCTNPLVTPCTTPVGNLTVRSSGTAGDVDITTTAAFVLVSHGANGWGAFTRGGAQQLPGGGVVPEGFEVENYAGTLNLYRSEYYGLQRTGGGFTTFYDDLILYRTRQQIEFEVLDPAKMAIGENVPVAGADPEGRVVFCFDFNPGDTTPPMYEPNTPGVIDSVEEALAAYSQTTNNQLNALLDSNGVAVTTSFFNPFADRMLAILWNMQEVCHYYYGESGRLAGGKVCPPGNNPAQPRAYDAQSGVCRCPPAPGGGPRFRWTFSAGAYGCW